MIEIKHLCKTYNKTKEVIDDMNLTFPNVGLNIIVGKSGCGKTTLINILGGMDLDYRGEVRVDGQTLSDMKYDKIAEYRNYFSAFIFQINSLFEFMSVEDNLQLCLDIQGNDAKISEALERVGLKGFEKKKVKALSGGEKQRVAIARALIKDCKIIFADEPTSALDSKNAHKIFQLFKEISKDRLVIMVTHDVKKATQYADRTIHLIDGKVEEEKVYQECTGLAHEIKEKKSKNRSLRPILFHNLLTGMVINIFVMLLLIATLCMTNIALEQSKVMGEYDNLGTLDETSFNVDRAINTQIENDVDLFEIVKRDDVDSAYYYLEHDDTESNKLDPADYTILTNNFSEYDIYEGARNSEYEDLIIPGCSSYQKVQSKDTSTGITRGWVYYSSTNYKYYTYDEDNDYDLTAGRLPESDNEILITDTVADRYLRNRAYAPGFGYTAYYTTYLLDYNDLLDDQYTLETSEGGEETFDNVFTIFDTYGSAYGALGGEFNYPVYTEEDYKVVGIIDTNTLPFYTYNYENARYYLLNDFETQTGDEEFMNSITNQPYGYVVLPSPLGETVENQFKYEPITVPAISYNGYNFDSSIYAFKGLYDYTGNGLAGYEDNLNTDVSDRVITKSISSSELNDNEILITINMAEKLFPSLSINSYNAIDKFASFQNQEVTLQLKTSSGDTDITFKVVGLCTDTNGDMYVSDDMYSTIYNDVTNLTPTLTINLQGKSLQGRKALMEKLYSYGYALIPINKIPGEYLEMVEGEGEMIAKVDYDGLTSLYPDYSIVSDDGSQYFYVDGVNYGKVVDEYVYMTSSMVRKIAIDDSYYESQGNISPYYLFSDYYTDDNAQKGNSILSIIQGLYQFFMIVAFILAFGFIYLKEYRERHTITKLSMLGVKTKDLIKLNLITYIPMAILIGALSLLFTWIFINNINGLYSYSFINYLMNQKEAGTYILSSSGDKVYTVATVNRIRLLFSKDSYIITLWVSLGAMAIMLASSIAVSLSSRKRK